MLKHFILITAIISIAVQAEGFTFQPRAYIGYGDYSLESKNFDYTIFLEGQELQGQGEILFHLNADQSDSKRSQIEIQGLMAGIGATLAYEQIYIDAYYQKLYEDSYNSGCADAYGDYYFPDYKSCISDQKPQDALWRSQYSDLNADRDEYAFSLGYIINDNLFVFAGWRNGETNWDQKESDNNDYFGSRKGKFELDGPFMGFGYTRSISDIGVFAFKIAYGTLDGKLKQTDVGGYPGTNPETVVLDLSGEADAWSVGVGFNGIITGRLGYNFGIDYHFFDFDMSGNQGKIDANLDDMDLLISLDNGSLEEEMWSFKAGLVYAF